MILMMVDGPPNSRIRHLHLFHQPLPRIRTHTTHLSTFSRAPSPERVPDGIHVNVDAAPFPQTPSRPLHLLPLPVDHRWKGLRCRTCVGCDTTVWVRVGRGYRRTRRRIRWPRRRDMEEMVEMVEPQSSRITDRNKAKPTTPCTTNSNGCATTYLIWVLELTD